MRYLTLAALALMAACSTTTTTTTSDKTAAPLTAVPTAEPGEGNSVLVLTQAGSQLGTLAAQTPQFSSEAPGMIAWLPGSGGIDEQGRAVPGVKFVAWNEGGWTHVRAYALVAQPGETNLHNTNVLESRMLGEYVMHYAESAAVAELARYGVTPLIVKAT